MIKESKVKSGGVKNKPNYERPSPPEGQAMRYNDGKPQLSYVMSARYAIEGAAKVMEAGALKYERDNWKKSFPKEALIDSMCRHIAKFMDGEELDEETGLPHVDHVLCNAIFLSYHYNGRKPK